MNTIIRYVSATLLALAAVVSAWFLLNNLQPLSPGLYSFTTIFLIGIAIFLKLFAGGFLHKTSAFLRRVSAYKHLTLIAIPLVTLAGILVRLYFYFHFSYAPVSDPVTFYDAGQRIAEGHGMAGNSYAAFFPYLAAYDSVLGLAMRAINSPWLATILLNTAFDLGAAFALYFLMRKLTKPGSKLPLVAFGVWLLSPFNILFSVLSLPIIQVNFFIITALLLVCLLSERVVARRLAQSFLLAALLGIILGVGSAFRPVFTVAIVALFVLFLYILLTNQNRKRLALMLGATFLLVIALFFGLQKLDLTFVARETGLNPPSNAAGWSVYVGSNWDTDGQWSRADEIRMSQICKNTKSFEDCHEKLQAAGIKRYKRYGVGGSLSLVVRKLYVFSSDQSNVYNANFSIRQYTGSRVAKVMNVYIILFLLVLFYLSTRFLYRCAHAVTLKAEIAPVVLFIALLLLGFFLSDALVETAERYAQIMYPLFITVAVLSFELPGSKRPN